MILEFNESEIQCFRVPMNSILMASDFKINMICVFIEFYWFQAIRDKDLFDRHLIHIYLRLNLLNLPGKILPTWLHQGRRQWKATIVYQIMTHMTHFIIEQRQWPNFLFIEMQKNKSLYELIYRKTMRSQRNILRRISSFGTSKAPPTTPVPGKKSRWNWTALAQKWTVVDLSF